MTEQALLIAGQIGTPRGLRGDVSVIVRTDVPEDRFYPGAVLTTTKPDYPVLTVEKAGFHGDRLYVTFEEVHSREAAESLRHVELLVEPAEEEDAWYPSQLRGLSVVSAAGEDLGTVTGMQVGLAQDLLEVDADGQTVLVPMVQEILAEVDLDGRRIVLTPPEGLF